MRQQTGDPRKDTGPHVSRRVDFDTGITIAFPALMFLVISSALLFAAIRDGRMDERTRLIQRHDLPAASTDIVERGNGWIEFSLAVGGKTRRFLRKKHYGSAFGADNEVMVEVTHDSGR